MTEQQANAQGKVLATLVATLATVAILLVLVLAPAPLSHALSGEDTQPEPSVQYEEVNEVEDIIIPEEPAQLVPDFEADLFQGGYTVAPQSSDAPQSVNPLSIGGNGTQDSPLIIETAFQLAEIAKYTNLGDNSLAVKVFGAGAVAAAGSNGGSCSGTCKTDADLYLKLGNDIDLADWGVYDTDVASTTRTNWESVYGSAAAANTATGADGTGNVGGWVPIGKGSNAFKAHFVGNTKVISNLKINRTDSDGSGADQGLFGKTDGAQIANLGVTNVNVNAYQGVGGLAGIIVASSVDSSYVTGSVSGTNQYFGGFIGYLQSSSSVTNSFFSGTVVVSGPCAGGLVGVNQSSHIASSYSTGSISNTGSSTGGLVGFNYSAATITSSYSTMSVSGTLKTGGLVGSLEGIGNTITNSLALNPSVTGNTDGNTHRIAGSKTTSPTLSNNYAYEGTLVNPSGGSCGIGQTSDITVTPAIDGLDGADIALANIISTATSSLGITIPSANLPEPYIASGSPFPADTGGTPGADADHAYEISTPKQLAQLACLVNSEAATPSGGKYNAKYYILTADIDLSDWGTYSVGDNSVTENNWKSIYADPTSVPTGADWGSVSTDSTANGWVPIGMYGGLTSAKQFEGVFDGDNHTVSNLKAHHTAKDLQGLFGYIYTDDANGYAAEVKNLGVLNAEVSGGQEVGALAGSLYGDTNFGVKISKSYATGSVVSSSAIGLIGGLVGSVGSKSEIETSYSSVFVDASLSPDVGGLAGENRGTIRNSYATGDVKGSINTGGLVGYNFFNSPLTVISTSYATGVVTGTTNTGGLVGKNENNGATIENSLALNPSVTGTTDTHRLVGLNTGSATLSNNYAYEGTLVNPTGGSCGTGQTGDAVTSAKDEVDGADVTLAQLGEGSTGTFWNGLASSAGTDVWYDVATTNPWTGSSAWTIAAGSLPKLTGTAGTPFVTSQNPALPANPAAGPFPGTGADATNAYEISTPKQLAQLACLVNYNIDAPSGGKYNTKFYKLTNDIDLSDWGTYTATDGSVTENNWQSIYSAPASVPMGYNATGSATGGWAPIGYDGTSGGHFKGNFNGNEKVISNLKISRSGGGVGDYYQGLFGYTEQAVISNLGVTNVNIQGSNYTGGLVAYNYKSIISFSYVTGKVSGSSQYTGGLVGNNKESTITSSYVAGAVSGGGRYIGGLVAFNSESTITSSYTTGSAVYTGSAQGSIGGLAGYNVSLISPSQITSSYSTMVVSGKIYTGGLVAQNTGSSATITNSLALNPSVTGTGGWVHRLVGINDNSATSSNSYGLASTLVNTAAVTGEPTHADLDGATVTSALLRDLSWWQNNTANGSGPAFSINADTTAANSGSKAWFLKPENETNGFITWLPVLYGFGTPPAGSPGSTLNVAALIGLQGLTLGGGEGNGIDDQIVPELVVDISGCSPVSNFTKTYDGSADASSFKEDFIACAVLKKVDGGDPVGVAEGVALQFNASTGAGSFNDATVPLADTITFGGLELTGANAGNYVLSSGEDSKGVTAAISKATPSVLAPYTAAGNDIVYGQPLSDVALGARITWNTPSTTATSALGAQSYPATYTPADTDNFNTVPLSVALNVTARPVNFTLAKPAPYIFDGAPRSPSINSASAVFAPISGATGLLSADAAGISVTASSCQGTYVGDNVNAGSKVVNVTSCVLNGVNSERYSIGTITIPNGEILKDSPDLTLAQSDVVYGPYLTPSIGGNYGNGTTTLSYYSDNEGAVGSPLASSPFNVGTYWVRVDVAQTQNYTAGSTQVKYQITPKPLTVDTSACSLKRVTGGTAAITDDERVQIQECLTLDALLPGDTGVGVTFTGGTWSQTTAGSTTVALTGVALTGGLARNNYSLASDTLSVNGEVAVEGTNGTISMYWLNDGDDAFGFNDGATKCDYSLAFSKEYDGTVDPGGLPNQAQALVNCLGLSTSNGLSVDDIGTLLENNEDFNITSVYYNNANTGSRTLSLGFDFEEVTSGYTLLTPKLSHAATIEKKELSFSASACKIEGTTVYDGQDVIYDGDTRFARNGLNLAGGGSLTFTADCSTLLIGFANSEYLDSSMLNKFAYHFSDKNVGTSKPIFWSVELSENANYTLSGSEFPITSTAEITPAPLTLSGTVNSKVYDGNNDATWATGPKIVGTVYSGDIVRLGSGGGISFSTANAGATVSFSAYPLAGADGDNYSLTQLTSLTATITTRPLTVSLNPNCAPGGSFVIEKKIGGAVTATEAPSNQLSTDNKDSFMDCLQLNGRVTGETSIKIDPTSVTGAYTTTDQDVLQTVAFNPTLSNYTLNSGATNYTLTNNTQLFALDGRIVSTGDPTPPTPPVTQYTVSFNLNGASNASDAAFNSRTRNEGASIGSIPTTTPAKSDYEFDGWYLVGSDTPFAQWDALASSNITLVAHWREIAPTTSIFSQDVHIDYINETVTGLVNGATYNINNRGCTAITGTSVPYTWFANGSISIVKCATADATYHDSSPASLSTVARPSAPNTLVPVAPSAFGESDGQITGLDATMVYNTVSADFAGAWTTGAPSANFAAGVYFVRIPAAASSFSASGQFNGLVTTVVIPDGPEPEPGASCPTGYSGTAWPDCTEDPITPPVQQPCAFDERPDGNLGCEFDPALADVRVLVTPALNSAGVYEVGDTVYTPVGQTIPLKVLHHNDTSVDLTAGFEFTSESAADLQAYDVLAEPSPGEPYVTFTHASPHVIGASHTSVVAGYDPADRLFDHASLKFEVYTTDEACGVAPYAAAHPECSPGPGTASTGVSPSSLLQLLLLLLIAGLGVSYTRHRPRA